MPQATADIVASTGSTFTFTTSSGTVTGAIFQGTSTGTASVVNNIVSVANLPAGDSTLLLTIIWAPGELDAVIQVTSSAHPLDYVTSAAVLTDGVTTGIIEFFGK